MIKNFLNDIWTKILSYFEKGPKYGQDRDVKLPEEPEKQLEFPETSYYVESGKLLGAKFEHIENELELKKINPKGIVIHYTATKSLKPTLEYFKNNPVSIHLLIDVDGTVIQTLHFHNRAYHAKMSSWNGYSELNNHFIGIEVVNLGFLDKNGSDYFDCYGSIYEGPVRYVEVVGEKYWAPFTELQEKSLKSVCKALVKHYSIDPLNVCGHHECCPGRKVDPGGSLSVSMGMFRLNLIKG